MHLVILTIALAKILFFFQSKRMDIVLIST